MDESGRHSLLRRQLRRFFAPAHAIPEDWRPFLGAVDAAYQEFDDDRALVERALELSSQELLRANADLHALFRALPDVYLRVDASGTVRDWKTGGAAEECPRRSVVGLGIDQIALPYVTEPLRAALTEALVKRTSATVEYTVRAQHFEARTLPLLESEAVAIVRDISERKRAARKLAASRQRLENLVNATSGIVWEADADTLRFTFVSARAEAVLGYPRAAWTSEASFWLDRIHPQDRNEFLRERSRLSAQGGRHESEYRVVAADGREVWVHDVAALVVDGEGHATLRGLILDTTEHKRAAIQLSQLATHDPITGLVRYVLAQQEIDRWISGAGVGDQYAVLLVVLERFASVNDTYGYSNGDRALRICADRLRARVDASSVVCRLADDAFLVGQRLDAGTPDAEVLAKSLRDAISEPIGLGPYALYLTCNVGVATFPDHGATATELRQAAEVAANRAKAQTRNSVGVATKEQVSALRDRMSLGGRLLDAIRAGELVLHYQPQVDAVTGRVVSLEALVRWQTHDLGLLPPSRFLRVAEELGLIVPLGRWVIDEACRQARGWIDGGLGDVIVAVNVSALQLQRPGFVDEVRVALHEARLPPQMLEVEITETAIMEGDAQTAATVRRLKDLGVRIALDDFGTGYSSLSQLKHLPIDKLKIDQSFVREVSQEVSDAAITRAIIAMGHQLNLTVAAEGVETGSQVGFLRRSNCDQLQGFIVARPAPSCEVAAWLRQRRFEHVEADSPGPERGLLLLDDETNVLHALQRVLRGQGYRIHTADCAARAFDLLAQNEVRVIISDERMPDMRGTEFLSRVKELHPNTIRIVLSGYTDLDAVTAAINRGAIYRFMTKPWDDDDLKVQVREAFRAHGELLTR